MKIGILTFYYCHNYGAMLQAFALRFYLKSLGHEVYFIKHKLPILSKRYTLFRFYLYKNQPLFIKVRIFFGTLLNLWLIIQKKRKFISFMNKYLPEINENSNDLDLIIIGSDQVWNPYITGGFDEYYWGDYSKKKGIPTISYAVSCPSSIFTDNLVEKIKNNFIKIGVRENLVKEKLNGNYKINAELTVDPTFLLSSSAYKEFMQSRLIDNDYYFAYNLTNNSDLKNKSIEMSKINNIKLIDIQSKQYKVSGPLDFINLIYYSNMMFVSSFHGTVFSLIFHKKFLFFPSNDERDERVLSLLTELNCLHLVYNSELNLSNIKYDWAAIDKKINESKIKSEIFINSVIKNEIN